VLLVFPSGVFGGRGGDKHWNADLSRVRSASSPPSVPGPWSSPR